MNALTPFPAIQAGPPAVAATIAATTSSEMVVDASTEEIKSRDHIAKQEEEHGEVRFETISNDKKIKHVVWLCGLKNIFGAQLPKMPKEYIVRLVLDRNHRSVVVVKENRVIGGICFRPYYQQRFAEIAFCAITTSEQVKGYGTRLMNHLKEVCKKDSIDHFLTYADNFAIGYFKKQGFRMNIQMPRERWAPFIKDYEGGTLMECYVNPNINYLDIPGMISRQKRALEDKINSLTKAHIIYPGIVAFKEGTQSIQIEDIPGVVEAGWTPQTHKQASYKTRGEVESDTSALTIALQEVLTNIKKHKDAWPFQEPVNPELVPDYLEVIKDPIDLQTIQARLAQGFYKTKDIFIADLHRMCQNCRTFNPPNGVYFLCAQSIDRFASLELKRVHLL